MNSESSLLPSTGTISKDIAAIWPGALLCAYLGVTAMLLAFGAGEPPWPGLAAHLLALGAAAVATLAPAVRPWLRRWLPVFLILFLYAELPLLISAAGHTAIYDRIVIAWEQRLFGGQPALDWAARWPSRALSELLHTAYLAYYPIIFAVPLALQRQRRYAELSRAVFVLMLTFITCFVTYVVFPVAGPRYLWPSPASETGGVARAFALWLLESQSSRGTAFPSSHVAVATTQAILAFVYFRARGLLLAVCAALLAVGAVYGGFHYLIDALVGVAYGALATALGLALTARYANATAPT
jgi:membrane-associated phospholipid phosphatase